MDDKTDHDAPDIAEVLELDADGRALDDLTRPDQWAPGLNAAVKPLNTSSVKRATKPAEVVPVCLAHNLRDGNEDHRHRRPIDASRTGTNTVLRGPARAAVGAELAQSILDELGVVPPRVTSIMAVEIVVQVPEGCDTPAAWLAALEWIDTQYKHVLSAVVHRDQTRPHMHVIALAVADGRLCGHELTSGDRGLKRQRFDLMHHLRDTLNLRADRAAPKLDPVARLALTSGKGAKTAAAAARRDAELARLNAIAAELGVAVDGRSGITSGLGVAVGGRSGSPENLPLRPPTADLADPTTELLVPVHKVAEAVAETETAHAAELARLRQRLTAAIDEGSAAEARAVIAAHHARKLAAEHAAQLAADQQALATAHAGIRALVAEHCPRKVTPAERLAMRAEEKARREAERTDAILSGLVGRGWLTAPEIEPFGGASLPVVTDLLHRLAERGLVEMGQARSGSNLLRTVYRLPDPSAPPPAGPPPRQPTELQRTRRRLLLAELARRAEWAGVADLACVVEGSAVVAPLLAEAGLVETRAGQTRHGKARREYRLSAAGRAALASMGS